MKGKEHKVTRFYINMFKILQKNSLLDIPDSTCILIWSTKQKENHFYIAIIRYLFMIM